MFETGQKYGLSTVYRSCMEEEQQPQTLYPGLPIITCADFAQGGGAQVAGRTPSNLALATACVRLLTPSLP